MSRNNRSTATSHRYSLVRVDRLEQRPVSLGSCGIHHELAVAQAGHDAVGGAGAGARHIAAGGEAWKAYRADRCNLGHLRSEGSACGRNAERRAYDWDAGHCRVCITRRLWGIDQGLSDCHGLRDSKHRLVGRRLLACKRSNNTGQVAEHVLSDGNSSHAHCLLVPHGIGGALLLELTNCLVILSSILHLKLAVLLVHRDALVVPGL
ncbi:hypothetical protein D9M71_503360 [compost metagenome]